MEAKGKNRAKSTSKKVVGSKKKSLRASTLRRKDKAKQRQSAFDFINECMNYA